MPPLAVAPVGLSRKRHMLRVNGNDDDVGLVNQQIELVPARLALSCLDDERRLEQRRRRNQAGRVVLDRRAKRLGLGLVEQQRDYMTVPAADIKHITPTLTMVGGRVVFSAAK